MYCAIIVIITDNIYIFTDHTDRFCLSQAGQIKFIFKQSLSIIRKICEQKINGQKINEKYTNSSPYDPFRQESDSAMRRKRQC